MMTIEVASALILGGVGGGGEGRVRHMNLGNRKHGNFRQPGYTAVTGGRRGVVSHCLLPLTAGGGGVQARGWREKVSI